MAKMMRRFTELSGLQMGERMEEMMTRLEAGEDPEALEEEAEDLGEDEGLDDFFQLKKALREGRRRRPRVDEELYFL